MRNHAIRCGVCLIVFLLLLAACEREAPDAEIADAASLTVASGFTFDTDAYAPPTERGTNLQEVRERHLQDLERPEALIYVVDGKAKVFPASHPKFEEILKFNIARDTIESSSVYLRRDLLELALPENFWEHGRYLIYRYGADDYEDLIFSLPKADEVDDSGDEWALPWVVERTEGVLAFCYLGPYTDLSAADELIAYIETD